MAKNNWLIPTLLVLGLLTVLLSVFFASRTTKQSLNSLPLAQAELIFGQADIYRAGIPQKENLTQRNFLYHLDSIETRTDGDVNLSFDSGYRIRMPENTLITISNDSGKPLLLIKRGELIVENFGQDNSVMISAAGKHWTATDYEMIYKKQFADTNTQSDNTATTSVPVPSESGSLTSEYLQDTLKAHRASFFKCYTQLLQKTPGVVGHASLSFTIERTGKISQSDVASSNIQDAAFRKCLLDALRRVEFRAFSGDPISTIFPLRFE